MARAEPVLVSIEAQGALPVTAPQSRWFGAGAVGALAIQYPVTPMFLLGLRLRAGMLSDGPAPSEPGLRDPGVGTFEQAAVLLRVRPLSRASDVRRATGLFVDVGGGGGVTGDLGRANFEAGLGYGLALGGVTLAPTLRYLQVVQPTRVLGSDDARLLMLGLEATLTDARPRVHVPKRVVMPKDRDHDGIDDLSDKCPDEPEDMDGHADNDGCPDPDNDGDGVLDVNDKCPDEAEDFDQFEDDDGCPDPDNDKDGFLDADDQCPNEAEVVNGNKDYDGCPDKGLIVMENDRIVLEERVLFDFERSRVKHEARPVLRAIVKLYKQHPEWVTLRIEGHTDVRGNAEFNQELSERRAQRVMYELIKLGIPASKIHAIGYGATRLRDKRKTEEAHQRNRRVEFVVEARRVVPNPKQSEADTDKSQLQPAEAAGAGSDGEGEAQNADDTADDTADDSDEASDEGPSASEEPAAGAPAPPADAPQAPADKPHAAAGAGKAGSASKPAPQPSAAAHPAAKPDAASAAAPDKQEHKP